MSEKTKASIWIPWAIALCIAVLLYFLIDFMAGRAGWLGIFPITMADAINSMAAIDQFQTGIPAMNSYWNARVAALLGMIIFFVIGPTLWVWGEAKSSERKTAPWYAGTALTMAGIYIFASGLVSSINTNQQNAKLIATNKYRQELQAELATVSYEVIEQYWLSDGFERDSLTVQNLDTGLETENMFVIKKQPSDSVITIYAIGNIQGRNPHFENINGQKGRIQVVAKVTPVAQNIDWISSAGN